MIRTGNGCFRFAGLFFVVTMITGALAYGPDMDAACVFTCTMNSAPRTGTTEEPVEFELEAASSGCPGTPEVIWDFGDGETTTGTKKPEHLYTVPGSFNWSVTVRQGVEVCTRSGTIIISSPCPIPGRPEIDPDSATVKSGEHYTVSWSPAESLSTGGTYVLETSRSNAFFPIELTATPATRNYLLSVPSSNTEYRLYVRVRAVQLCGTVGQNSSPLVLQVQPNIDPSTGSSFIFTRPGPSWVKEAGDSAPSANVKVRNVGTKSAQITFTATGGFFDVTPTSLTLDPGDDEEVTLRAKASAMIAPGFFSGSLEGVSGSSRIATAVTLQVTSGSGGGVEDLEVKTSVSRLVYKAPKGQNPAPQTVKLKVSHMTAGQTVYLSPLVGPGGSWLIFDPAAFASPVPASGEVNLSLSVDRARRTTADGQPPLRTFLRVGVSGGLNQISDVAVIEILDIEDPVTGGNAGSSRPAGTDSLILPVVVRAPGFQGATYVTDGWIRNIGTTTAKLDIYWTPLGADGRLDVRVLRNSGIEILAGQLLQLSDLVQSVFGLTEGTGLVEIRSDALGDLLVRSSVQSTIAADSTLRFSGGLDPVTGGDGIGVNEGRFRLSWVQASASKRYNVQISETSGASASGLIEVFDETGKRVGQSVPFTVAPLSVSAFSGIVDWAEPGRTLQNGYAEIRVTQGVGKIVVRGQLLDNITNSFASFTGTLVANEALAKRSPAAATESFLVLPAAVKSPGQGTVFSTKLTIENTSELAAARVTLTYHYIDGLTGEAKVQEAPVGEIAPRAIKTYDDVLGETMGMTVDTPSYGWISLKTEIVGTGTLPPMTAEALITALVDPLDPAKGEKQSRVAALAASAPEWTDKTNPDGERQLPGLEETVENRTNFHVVEVSGKACRVQVRAVDRNGDQAGLPRDYDIAPYQYFQLNGIFTAPAPALDLGEGPWDGLTLLMKVLDGDGRILAFATLNNNVSKQPEVLVLTTPKRKGPK